MGGQAVATQRQPGDLAGEYFEQLSERFELAVTAAGEELVEELEVAGLRLRLRFAGEAMRRVLLSPFEHLTTAAVESPDLTISLFDTASSSVEPPLPPWEPAAAAPGTNPVMRLRSERVSVLAATGSGALTAANVSAGRAVFHLPDAERVPASERAAPMRDALQLLMAARGRLLVHAGAVGRDGRGVLLVGRGGSGKSTLALACALAGMEIVADDYALLEPEPLLAHAMQSTAKLTEDSAELLGLTAPALDPARFEPTLEGPAKALVEISALAPERMRRRLEIGALLAPRIGAEEDPALRPIPAADGLRAVAPSTIVQSGAGAASALAGLADLVRRVPCFELGLGNVPVANAAAVEGLVSELG